MLIYEETQGRRMCKHNSQTIEETADEELLPMPNGFTSKQILLWLIPSNHQFNCYFQNEWIVFLFSNCSNLISKKFYSRSQFPVLVCQRSSPACQFSKLQGGLSYTNQSFHMLLMNLHEPRETTLRNLLLLYYKQCKQGQIYSIRQFLKLWPIHLIPICL